MAKPGSGGGTGKITVKGTRHDDNMAVVAQGVMVNGTLKEFSETQINAGFILNGDAGNDRIAGGSGPDQLNGGPGDDFLIGTMADRYDGGRGIDTIDLSGSPTAVGVNLVGLTSFFDVTITTDENGFLDIQSGEAVNGVAKNIENIVGSDYNDWLLGNGLENLIRGGGGDDSLSVQHSDGRVDKLFGDDGNDELFVGSGDDEMTGGAGADKFVVNPGSLDGHWVIHDFNLAEGDRAYAFPYSGDVAWASVDYLGTPSLQAQFVGGDTLTFVGITDTSSLDLIVTSAWPGG